MFPIIRPFRSTAVSYLTLSDVVTEEGHDVHAVFFRSFLRHLQSILSP